MLCLDYVVGFMLCKVMNSDMVLVRGIGQDRGSHLHHLLQLNILYVNIYITNLIYAYYLGLQFTFCWRF